LQFDKMADEYDDGGADYNFEEPIEVRARAFL
jgi:hypothetical protein